MTNRFAGVGNRWAAVFKVDPITGLPEVASPSKTPTQPVLIQRVKTFAPSDPEPQRITHYGDDKPHASDALPPTEIGSFVVTTAQTNLPLEALFTDTNVVSEGASGSEMRFVGVNTDKRGRETRVAYITYRQAINTDKDSPLSGIQRVWHGYIYPSVLMSPATQSMEQGATDKTYNATVSPSSVAIWGESFTEAKHGFTAAEGIQFSTRYEPRFNAWKGNGTFTDFILSHPPVNADALKVWVAGTLQTPSNVNTSLTNPSFTLSAPPPNNAFIFAMIETNNPGAS